jgi:hypothetical protein
LPQTWEGFVGVNPADLLDSLSRLHSKYLAARGIPTTAEPVNIAGGM